MALSVGGMLLAAGGLLTPIAGALVQEGIDLAVIANALRALGGGRRRRRPADEEPVGRQVRHEHELLLPELGRLRAVADQLDVVPPAVARTELAALRRFLDERLLPHERAEDATLYPIIARAIGGHDPTAPMTRAHLEIAHLARLYGRLLDSLPPRQDAPLAAEDRRDLRRVLYGLHSILRLHFAQEEEHYLPLLDEAAAAPLRRWRRA